MRYLYMLAVVFMYAICYNEEYKFDGKRGNRMFCKNCGTDVTGMKYCPKCGTYINDIPKKTTTYIPLTEKDYRMHYIASCCLSTLLFAVYGLLHSFNTVERYNGKGLEFITNKAMAQLVGAFLGITILCAYDVFKQKVQIRLWKMLSVCISSVVTQIIGVIVLFFVYIDAPTFSDIELFEWSRRGFKIAFGVILLICAVFVYMVCKQKKIGVRSREQELYSSVMLSAIIATVETFVIWKVIL